MAEFPAYQTSQEWIEAGYLWRHKRCPAKGCGLPVIEFFLPNDPPFRVDPETMGAHAAVCGDKGRVERMHAAEDREEREREHMPVDGKQRAAGER